MKATVVEMKVASFTVVVIDATRGSIGGRIGVNGANDKFFEEGGECPTS
jgi:hypothetical protein